MIKYMYPIKTIQAKILNHEYSDEISLQDQYIFPET